MSYILDALKKSERERQRGKIPTLGSIHDPSPVSSASHFSGQRKLYSSLILLFLAVAAAALIWYRLKHSPTNYAPVAMEQAITTTEKEEEIPSIDVAEKPPATPDPPFVDNIETPSPPPTITTRSKKIKLLVEQEVQPEVKEIPVSLPPQQHRTIPNVRELPPTLQTAIPELNLAGHTYSDTPEKRMIIINGDILREGDRVNDNIRLIEITWTGVILDRNGQQFTVEIE